MSLTRLALARPIGSTALLLGVLAFGAFSLTRIPVALLPDVSLPRLEVLSELPGAAPEEVERRLTVPVERAVSTLPGVEGTESVSRQGRSRVALRYPWGTDMDRAALEVREQLDLARDGFPAGSPRPLVLHLDPASEPLLEVSVSGRSLPELTRFARDRVGRRLEALAGVARVEVRGGVSPEVRVNPDPVRMASLGVAPAVIHAALAGLGAGPVGGSIRDGPRMVPLRISTGLGDASRLAELPLRILRADLASDSGGAAPSPPSPLRLGEVAAVELGYSAPRQIIRAGGREAVGLRVYKTPAANAPRVDAQVRAALGELRRAHPGMMLQLETSQAGFIRQALANLAQEVVLGGTLAFLVLFLFLRDPRYPLAVGMVIPVALLATAGCLYLAGMSLNLMTLGGLALGVGLLMDNSIVVLENIVRHREAGASAAQAALAGAEEVSAAITASTLTNLAVFAPILCVHGAIGAMLGPLAVSIGCALLVSILVALTLLPALAARWPLRGATPPLSPRSPRPLRRMLDRFERAFARLAAAYREWLDWALGRRWRTLSLGGAVAALGCMALLGLPRSLFPAVEESRLSLNLTLPPGTSLATTAAAVAGLHGVLGEDPGVRRVFSVSGAGGDGSGALAGAEGPGVGSREVQLQHGARAGAVFQRLAGGARVPAGSLSARPSHASTLTTLLGESESPLRLRVVGVDPGAALGYAQLLRRRLAASPALSNLHLQGGPPQTELRIGVNAERALARGVDPGEAAAAVADALGSEEAAHLAGQEGEVPVLLAPRPDADPWSTARFAAAGEVPLRDLLTRRQVAIPSEIYHSAGARVVTVLANPAPGVPLAEANQSMRRLTAAIPPPPGLAVEAGGGDEEMRRGFGELRVAFILALGLCYLLLAAEFESLLQPLIVLLAVPLAAAGSAVALWAGGSGINTMSLIGLVVLVGIVDNDAVVKLDFINRARREGLSRREAIHAAGEARFRPIVMNTVTAGLGLFPMALGIGPGGSLQAPLAQAVLGGLLSATALTLVVIPAAYDLLDELHTRRGGVTRMARMRIEAGGALESGPGSSPPA
jgi:HAE1 family hydrophobic/amphiphilic exporter-1